MLNYVTFKKKTTNTGSHSDQLTGTSNEKSIDSNGCHGEEETNKSSKASTNLQNQLESLSMKMNCCQAGESSGSLMTTFTTLEATQLCQYEAGKYTKSLNLSSINKQKSCDDCFATCCLEKVMSPKPSSCQVKSNVNTNDENNYMETHAKTVRLIKTVVDPIKITGPGN